MVPLISLYSLSNRIFAHYITFGAAIESLLPHAPAAQPYYADIRGQRGYEQVGLMVLIADTIYNFAVLLKIGRIQKHSETSPESNILRG